ncbi:MAG: serine/threonine-protein kinase [Prosthecobacter sp.]
MSQETPPQHQPPFEVPSIQEIGALLPQYVFEKLSAFGGMGAVYKARQESLDRPVAIKILPPAFGAEPEFAERFKSEARAMAKLNHSNIVAVYDFGITSGAHLYLVMEWVEGPTLHELIHKGTIPVKKAASLAMQLCDALSYAHNHRLLHRDIKPGNIMVNQEDQVKVTDFGLARPITGEAEENPYGTPDYAAPEILGKGSVDQRADIYAAGIVLYEMLTGRVPKTPRRSVTEYAPLSPGWDTVIDLATHPDLDKRFMDARDLRAHISNMLSKAEVAAIPVAIAVVEEGRPKTPGLKPLHLALIGAAVVIIGALLWMFLTPGAEPDKAARAAEAKEKRAQKRAQEAEADNDAEKSKKKRVATPKPKPEPEMAAKAAPEPVPEKEEKTRKKPVVVVEEPPAMAAASAQAAAPVPVPVPAPTPPPPAPPKPEAPHEIIQRLEERDAELAQLVATFESEWSSNSDIDTEAERRELAGKYIPALQRSLTGLQPEQRDHVLSEISHVANREPLNAPAETWPPVLKNLRQAYDSQSTTIQSAADAAAEKVRSDQCALLMAKAKEREAAGNANGARLAEAVAAGLARLSGPPSVKALKDHVAVASSSNAAP